MSSKTAAAAATTNGSSELKYEARLCHVVKRADFDGYGFNLHAEKGRPGQYIGKVDDGSPAESAGLRQGDRIIEVNGTNITTETHKKVVELIKAVPNETKLLVIDPRAEGADLKAAIAKSGTTVAKSHGVDVNDNSKHQEKEKAVVSNGKDSLNDKKQQHDVNGTSEDVNNKKNAAANNNVDTSANKMVNGAGDVKKSKPVDQIIEDTKALSMANGNGTKAAEANGNGKQNGSAPATVTKEGPKLNLNMTAAELRAQLAARKKYDPKNDVCDLRKKYEIIQKM
uniref:Putative ezrin-radixin-moesin-binding phosphoprotein 50 n=1 Tax=Culex tarsalis TaxID=7177 RepID=A0A1Q3FHA8_CULTA